MYKFVLLCIVIVGALASPVARDEEVVERDNGARYDPDRQIVYHLFTRSNPTISEPILNGNTGLLEIISYDPVKRTVVLIPGNHDDQESSFADTLIPAFLSVEDVNIIVVDWSRGSSNIYLTAVRNSIATGESVAKFINWLNDVTVANAEMYHIVGHGHGGHIAGIIGRHIDGEVPYVTGLDPSNYGWMLNSEKFRPDDARYTEVIHTSAGIFGYLGTLANVDFYPNGGVDMPGCSGFICDHERSYHYFAESLRTGGFNGQRCLTFITAMTGTCGLSGNVRMGGIHPKIGSRGIYHMLTNQRSPYSRG